MVVENPEESVAPAKPKTTRTRRKPAKATEEKSEVTIVTDPPQETVADSLTPETTPVDESPVPAQEPEERSSIERLKDLLDEAAEGVEQEEKTPVAEPPSPNGVIVAPGYWQGFAGPYGRINVFAWLGVAFAVLFFPLGLIFSALGLKNAEAVPSDKLGKIVSWIGVGISSLYALALLLWVLMIPFRIFLSHVDPLLYMR